MVKKNLAGEYETSLRPSETTINNHSTTTKQFIYHVSRQQTEEPHLSELVEQFWKIESEGIQENSSVLSDEDNGALKVFQKIIRHNSERYEIGFPWKTPCLLEKSFYSALNQLKCLEKRVGNNPTLKEKYDQTLSTDLIKIYKKPVEMTEPEPEKIWYLSHHPVQNPNPNKPRKIPRVANAASKYRGQSLNSNLLTGPHLLNRLLGTLLRFREHPVAILADFESMFMQIAVKQEDQSALRFLWSKNNFIMQYQFTRLIFGATCSPSMAIFVLNLCTKDNAENFPKTFAAIAKQFYIDDCVHSLPTITEAKATVR